MQDSEATAAVLYEPVTAHCRVGSPPHLCQKCCFTQEAGDQTFYDLVFQQKTAPKGRKIVSVSLLLSCVA